MTAPASGRSSAEPVPLPVLVVDDDADHAAWVRAVLAADAIEVTHAATGLEGLRMVEAQDFAAVVVDGALPDLDGVEWIRRLRATGRKTPVVFASAFWRDSATLSLLRTELGVVVIASKPLVRDVFVEQFRRILGTRRSARRSQPAHDRVPQALATLKTAYLDRLPAKVADLERATLAALSEATPAATSLAAITHAHTLHGTAGTYGLAGVAAAAGRIEGSLLAHQRGELEHAGLREVIVEALAEMRRAVEGSVAGASQSIARDTVRSAQVLVASRDAQLVERLADLGRRRLVQIVRAGSLEGLPPASSERPLDAMMIDSESGGGTDPLAFAAGVRAIEGYEALPFAVLSKDGVLLHRIAALHAGATCFVPRDADDVVLGETMQQLVAVRHAERARVAIVDDDPEFLELLRTCLTEQRYVVETFEDGMDLVRSLEATVPDVVLLDVEMPGLSGLETCRLLRNDARWRRLPVLLVTAASDAASRRAAFRAGADDYIVKPVVLEELTTRIKNRVERSRLLAERADIDALTGLLTRRAFLDAAGSRLVEASRHGHPLVIAILDVDDFKHVNDEFGHAVGDRVLSGLGGLLRARLRREDLRCRWGGEEFVLCMPYTVPATAGPVIDKLREEAAPTLRAQDPQLPSISFSAGVAAFPEDGASLAALLEVADRRLYQAKAAGKARTIHEG